MEQLLLENRELRARLEEAEEALEAIRTGKVDAIVVYEPVEQVFTLKGVDRSYRVLIEAMNEGAAIISSDGYILYCNRRLGQMLGVPFQKAAGSFIFDYFDPVETELLKELLNRGKSGSARGEFRILAESGRPLPVNVSANPLPLDRSSGVCLVLTDLTEQKRGEALLRQERERLFQVLESLPAIVFLLGPDHTIQYANRLFRERFGDVENKKCFEILHECGQDRNACPGMRSLNTGASMHWELVHRPAGKIYQMHAYPFRDAEGPDLALLMGIDITARKHAEEELKDYTAALEKSNRELQEFAFVASHDLQEPLRKVQAFGDRIRSRFGEVIGEEGRDFLQRMTGAASRMQVLLDALLDYSRVATRVLPFSRTDLSAVVRGVVSDLEWAIEKYDGRIEIGELPSIEGDAVQMRQVFQNLISNSLKYRRENEDPVVRIHGRVMDDTAEIFVEDNAIGFEERYLDRIFKPFQRLHGRSEYEGIGMGLAICRRIVERHRGSITAVSKPGKGSTFIVRLPLKQDQ